VAGFEEDPPEPERDWKFRSVIEYPDPSPETTAAAWAHLRAERNARHEAQDDDDEYDIVITHPAEEFDDPCRPLAAYVKLAHANGWEIVTLAHALAFQKGKPFKSGANEGSDRPDVHYDTQWLFARKGGKRVVVSYTIANGEPRGTLTYRRCNGKRYADAALKNLIKGVEDDSGGD
jgi:hypothetical protein